eukprot:GHVU01209378.1.p2 GENE.GHVU01209378.1~~GHVU01209378.1.p2  ORF type:complete len:104 (+),score=7.88 GHVU01209378.1:222-533(+)
MPFSVHARTDSAGMMPCYQKRVRGRGNHIQTKDGRHKCPGVGGEGETLLALLLRKNANEYECGKDEWMRQHGSTTTGREQASFIRSLSHSSHISFPCHCFFPS